MTKIVVKKGNISSREIAEEVKVDLRSQPISEKKQPSKKWMFMGVILMVITFVGFFILSFLAPQRSAFNDIVSDEAVVFSVIDQKALYDQASPLYSSITNNNLYIQPALIKLNNYLSQNDLGFKEDILPFFKKDIAFVIMPRNSETHFPFLVLLEKENSLGNMSRFLDKIEINLKEDYNLTYQIYRQIKIITLDPLYSAQPSAPKKYVYAQVEEYFILSNSQASMENVINNIIDK